MDNNKWRAMTASFTPTSSEPHPRLQSLNLILNMRTRLPLDVSASAPLSSSPRFWGSGTNHCANLGVFSGLASLQTVP
jgi:hypothetical protein